LAKKTYLGVNHVHVGILAISSILLSIAFLFQYISNSQAANGKSADKGFDEFGYNYNARVFSGPADGVDRILDGIVWGDPTYAKDHLKMTWSKGWDDARFNGAPWTTDAWEDNQWNGMVPGGSGETWHYKIIWVGTELEDSSNWREGGYPIWGQFEVILSQGTVGGGHIWETHGIPAGYGMVK